MTHWISNTTYESEHFLHGINNAISVLVKSFSSSPSGDYVSDSASPSTKNDLFTPKTPKMHVWQDTVCVLQPDTVVLVPGRPWCGRKGGGSRLMPYWRITTDEEGRME